MPIRTRLLLSTVIGLAAASAPVAWSSAVAQSSVAASDAAILSPRKDGVDVRKGAMLMRVSALTDGIVRVRIAADGALPEGASWAVPQEVRQRSITVRALPDGFATQSLRVRIEQASGRLIVETPDGKPITSDAAAPVDVAGRTFTLRKQLPQSEHIFGLGDKTGGLDRREHSFVNWNTDAFGFGNGSDPIYKSIPFFIGTGGPGGSYGILLDNSFRSWFDFGHKDADTIAFGGPDGPIDYYVMAGPSVADVVRRYTDLTGRAPLAPKWALGYQQSRYSYMSAQELQSVASRLRAERIPTDVLWLDIDFQDRNRPFTVNQTAFPDMKGLAGALGKDGFKLVTITDLHVARAPGEGYAPYDSGVSGDRFIRNPDGTPYVAPVWPGPSVFPNFTDAQVRRWWGGLFKQQVADGIAGSWNDMNEPAIFETATKTMPLDTVHLIDSDDFARRNASHAEIHNVYGMENSRATYEGLRTLAPDERAFVMTRASYAGGHRYAVTWTGDNSSTWDHLKLSIHQIINLGLSGFAYSGADVSGFIGGPSADLLTRWFEIGAFYPIFRDHSAKDTPRVEPWLDGADHLAIRRRFVEERYRLMPYFYALADQNARHGDPIMRPVFYDYPSALAMPCDQTSAFTLGRSLLVAPPPTLESPQSYDVCLPAGEWFDYWSGKKVAGVSSDANQPIQSATQAVAGARAAAVKVRETPRLDHLPVFVRAGTVLPRQSLVQSTAQTPAGPLQLDIYPGDDCQGVIYEDDGHSMAFERGGFLRQTVRCDVTAQGVHVAFGPREGRFTPWWKEIAVTIHDWKGSATVQAGGHALAPRIDAAAETMAFTMSDGGKPVRITIDRK